MLTDGCDSAKPPNKDSDVAAGLADAMMVGDTPYDAEAAIAAGVTAIGTLGGHFSRGDLVAAGCIAVLRNPAELQDAVAAALALPSAAVVAH